MSRNFSSGNAYKLSKRIIIVIAVISLLYSLLMFNASWDYITGVEWIRSYNEHCKPIEDPQFRADCMFIWQDYYQSNYNRAWQALLVALMLPTVFFTITKTYNYLFPKSEKNKKYGK